MIRKTRKSIFQKGYYLSNLFFLFLQDNIRSKLIAMKRLKYIKWSIVIIIICSACTFSMDKVSNNLSQADKLIWSNPDSALHILQVVPAPERLNSQQQADYALLLSQAQYRCNIPASSDSLINIAVKYYKEYRELCISICTEYSGVCEHS